MSVSNPVHDCTLLCAVICLYTVQELPTDDPRYEAAKEKKAEVSQGIGYQLMRVIRGNA